MNKTAKKQELSKMISDVSSQIIPSTKLNQIQEFYEGKEKKVLEKVSTSARNLAKKINGAGLLGYSKQTNEEGRIFPNLTAFGQIILLLIFEDLYLMKLFLNQIQNSEQNLLFLKNNPYEILGIKPVEIKNLLISVILKINEWLKIFKISDIMKNYYIGHQICGIFLRSILLKTKNCPLASDCLHQLPNSSFIYSILFEHFDLNVVTKHKKNQTVFLFPDYNIFILTCNKDQFCTGRYYANEDQLLRMEKDVRKSTLFFLFQKNKQETEIQNFVDSEEQDSKNLTFKPNDKESCDQKFKNKDKNKNNYNLETNHKNFHEPVLDTPYFFTDVETPEFGMESLKFGKQINFQGAMEVAKSQQNKKMQDKLTMSPVFQSMNQQNQFHLDLNSENKENEQKDENKSILDEIHSQISQYLSIPRSLQKSLKQCKQCKSQRQSVSSKQKNEKQKQIFTQLSKINNSNRVQIVKKKSLFSHYGQVEQKQDKKKRKYSNNYSSSQSKHLNTNRCLMENYQQQKKAKFNFHPESQYNFSQPQITVKKSSCEKKMSFTSNIIDVQIKFQDSSKKPRKTVPDLTQSFQHQTKQHQKIFNPQNNSHLNIQENSRKYQARENQYCKNVNFQKGKFPQFLRNKNRNTIAKSSKFKVEHNNRNQQPIIVKQQKITTQTNQSSKRKSTSKTKQLFTKFIKSETLLKHNKSQPQLILTKISDHEQRLKAKQPKSNGEYLKVKNEILGIKQRIEKKMMNKIAQFKQKGNNNLSDI